MTMIADILILAAFFILCAYKTEAQRKATGLKQKAPDAGGIEGRYDK